MQPEYGLKEQKMLRMNFVNNFTKLFTTSCPNQNQIAAVLAGLTLRVSDKMNKQLGKPFIEEEIVDTLS